MRLNCFRILVMGTSENIQTKIHVDHMIDSLAKFCPKLERIEFRWDNDTLRLVKQKYTCLNSEI